MLCKDQIDFGFGERSCNFLCTISRLIRALSENEHTQLEKVTILKSQVRRTAVPWQWVA
jgi:hypothetical protein